MTDSAKMSFSKDQEALMSDNGQHGMHETPPPPYPMYETASGEQVQAVVIQPHGGFQYVTPSVAAQNVPDYLIYSVMATICCCWPIGLFAILKSVECRNAINRGDVNIAMQLSRQTRRLANWAIGVGVMFTVLSFLMMGIYIWFTLSQMH